MIILNDAQIEIHNARSIVKPLRQWFTCLDEVDRHKEHFFVALLDIRLRLKFVDVASIGILNASLVHPREVFVRAITHCAASILIAHNHPSGVCEPSDADITMTKRLREAGDILGISLQDHIIFTAENYFSFSETGTL